tara:strand:+ start:2208 stop:2867 length:660 start_codon:yes stop_codon:yes gene_type:complete
MSKSASKIKSAIASRGTAGRQMSKYYSNVTDSLMKSQFSSQMYELDRKESDAFYGTLASAVEVADTLAQGFEQKKELESDISAFEKSLPEGTDLRLEKKPTLMDYLSKDKKVKLSDVIYGQDEYYLGEKQLGSKYDIAARGKEIKSRELVDKLSDNMFGEKYSSPEFSKTLSDFSPELKFDFEKYSSIKLPDFLSKSADEMGGKEYFISDEQAQQMGWD